MTVAGAACSGAFAQTPAPPTASAPAAIPPPARVTTDTAEYCAELEDRADMHPAPPDIAREWIGQGKHLCARGHVVAGIARLRRALMVMRDPRLTPPPPQAKPAP